MDAAWVTLDPAVAIPVDVYMANLTAGSCYM